MSISDRRRQSVETSLTNLSLASSTTKGKKVPVQEVADSWEAEASSDDSETETLSPQAASSDYPSAPPPTPMTPSFKGNSSAAYPTYAAFGSGPYSPIGPASPRTPLTATTNTRPEKHVSTAARMIAGALGVRAPPKSEEMRGYERAVREAETRRRDKEREQQRHVEDEAERKRREVWDG